MGLKQMIANKNKSCAVALLSKRNAQLLDDLEKNTRNQQRNTNATTNTEALIDKDSIRNLLRNHDATVQKTDAQLLPLKTPQKLRTITDDVLTNTDFKNLVFNDDDNVNSANYYLKELPQIEEKTVKRNNPFNMDKYPHCITCNQCEHLSLTGNCKQLDKRVLPQALRECDSFKLLISERISPVEAKPYTHAELDRLLNQAAKPLYFHLIDCEQCSLEDTQYCGDGFVLGNAFDDLLLCFDDAANKRYLLMNRVIKARVSRRREFVPLSSD